MRTKKINLSNVQGKLTRGEMKNIMGGLASVENPGGDASCTLTCGSGSYTASCTSPTGWCNSSNATPKDWISCDGTVLSCC